MNVATAQPWKPAASKFPVWAPPLSPIRVEYSRDLLRSLIRERDQPDASGLIYGVRIPGGVRALASKPRKGLRVIGSYSARARGEIFLTESDLVHLDSLDPRSIALVIAGSSAGFFVRQTDGSIQTIKSYLEFPIRAPLPRPQLPAWLPLAFAAAASVAILVWPSQAFTIHQQNGALRIQLHRAHGLLEIADGPERRSIPLSPGLASILYAPQTSDVRIRLLRP